MWNKFYGKLPRYQEYGLRASTSYRPSVAVARLCWFTNTFVLRDSTSGFRLLFIYYTTDTWFTKVVDAERRRIVQFILETEWSEPESVSWPHCTGVAVAESERGKLPRWSSAGGNRKAHAPMLLRPPQIPLGLSRHCTRASGLGSRWLAAWSGARCNWPIS